MYLDRVYVKFVWQGHWSSSRSQEQEVCLRILFADGLPLIEGLIEGQFVVFMCTAK